MSKPQHCFDPACLRLAEHFAWGSEWVFKPEDLAQHVQDAVEDFFSELEASNPDSKPVGKNSEVPK